jgi:NAD(P)-dependent dehydrogenase (short-subunit alcohol dehydrogenase family)
MTTPRFDGQLAVVTGVGRVGQVGEAVAERFAALGASLALVDRTPGAVGDRAAALRARGATANAYACDLTDPAAVTRTATDIASTATGGVHALVCLAGGYASSGPLDESDPEIWNRMVAINLTTAYLTTRAFLPLVRQASGAIVYFASASALPGARSGKDAAYAAAKTGVVALMQSVAQQEKRARVRANALAPSSIRTGDNLASMGDDVAYVERETVADWVSHLCSEVSRQLTGQVLRLG